MLPFPSSAKGAAWEVKARSLHCAETSEAFEEGESLISRLVITEGGMERQDFKLKVWTAEKQGQSLIYWKTRFQPPVPRKVSPFQEDQAEEALRALLAENQPEGINTLFVLAVLLERKRVLVERAARRDAEGHLFRVYEHRGSGETFVIPDPELKLDQVAELQQEVALRLGWLPAPVPAPEAGAAETAEAGAAPAEAPATLEEEGE